MPKEIERKFIVDIKHHDRFLNSVPSFTIIQGYLQRSPATVRIRIKEQNDTSTAFITIKGMSNDKGISRSEWEYEIPVSEANEMLEEFKPDLLVKDRHVFEENGVYWEVDVLKLLDGRNLVIAEAETATIEESLALEIPSWISKDVSDNRMFAMSWISIPGCLEKAWESAYLV